jgi:hypothetical protein
MTRTALPLLLLAAGCPGDNKVGVYNTPPVVSIALPVDGAEVNEGDTVTFEGRVEDGQTDADKLEILWSSDVDGVFLSPVGADSSGVVVYPKSDLSVGNHTISLAATDEMGERTSFSITLTVLDVPDAPTLNIVHPANGESGVENEAFEFVVQVSDEQDAATDLSVSFESDVDGVFCTPTPDSIGVAECETALSAGDHRLTFAVTDSSGLRAAEEWYFTVISARAIDNDGDGFTEDQGDCDDGDGSVNPTEDEFYNERDDDCDGFVDEGTAAYDDDADGQSELDGDCNDANATIYLGAPEVCDGYDNDCDSIVDETTVCYDDDGDSYTENAGDCDDGTTLTYPGAVEVEDAADNDCDGIVDEGTNAFDDDGDGYTENAGDCNDGSTSISPAGTESCNGYDDDCDGTADERDASGCVNYYYDSDGDGYGSSTVSGRCQCSASSGYTSLTNNDCYDINASANPVATSFSATQRGDGSYDFNCDSTQEKRYGSAGSCGWAGIDPCSPTTGWDGSVAACGRAGTWIDDCDWVWFSCELDTSSRTQECR